MRYAGSFFRFESAARAPGRARTVAEFELSNGAKSWTLYDAVISPTSDPRQVELRYRCMDWADSRTGETGGDCGGSSASKKKKGNVEAGWKVEEADH